MCDSNTEVQPKTKPSFDGSQSCDICDLRMYAGEVGALLVCPWCALGVYRDGSKWTSDDPDDIRSRAAEIACTPRIETLDPPIAYKDGPVPKESNQSTTMEQEKKTVELTDHNFDELALKSDKVVVVDFWAPWCGPCRMVGPVIDELANEYDGLAVVGKMNVDDNPQIATKYGIRSIPTILFIKNGEVVDRSLGAVPKTTLASKLDTAMATETKSKDSE
jgi:thioredoxin 1